MKRLWLEWNGDKAAGVWEGRIWEAELEEGFTSAFLWGINLKAGDEIIRLIANDRDQEHGNRPLWIDCYRAVGMDDLDEAMGHMSQAVGKDVAEFFRGEIRENGFIRHIFPPQPVTTAAEERARQTVDMVSSDDILQGVRRMQEAGRVAGWSREVSILMPLHMYGPF